MAQLKKVVCFRNVHKMTYANPEELASCPDGQLPLKTHKTSWCSQDDANWLTAAIGTPAHFMAVMGGFGAGCLVHCEMYGIPGFSVTVITDSHSVTVESMQAFKPVMERLGLPSDLDNVASKPTFRPILKDANQRSNTIFS